MLWKPAIGERRRWGDPIKNQSVSRKCGDAQILLSEEATRWKTLAVRLPFVNNLCWSSGCSTWNIGARWQPKCSTWNNQYSPGPILIPSRITRCSEPGVGLASSHRTLDSFASTLGNSASVVSSAKKPPERTRDSPSETALSIRSTARIVTQSNSSRSDSARPGKTLAFNPSTETASLRKAAFLLCDSASVTDISGRQIAIGTPGRPAPLPKSRRVRTPTGKAAAQAIDSRK